MNILSSFPYYTEMPEVGGRAVSPEGVEIAVTRISPVSDYFVIAGDVTAVPKSRHPLLARHSWIFRIAEES